jgi:hypothetical protein
MPAWHGLELPKAAIDVLRKRAASVPATGKARKQAALEFAYGVCNVASVHDQLVLNNAASPGNAKFYDFAFRQGTESIRTSAGLLHGTVPAANRELLLNDLQELLFAHRNQLGHDTYLRAYAAIAALERARKL